MNRHEKENNKQMKVNKSKLHKSLYNEKNRRRLYAYTYYHRNKERMRAYSRERYKKNREVLLARIKEYNKKHRGEISIKAIIRRKQLRESMKASGVYEDWLKEKRAKGRERYKRSIDQRRAYKRAYYHKNKKMILEKARIKRSELKKINNK